MRPNEHPVTGGMARHFGKRALPEDISELCPIEKGLKMWLRCGL